MKALKLILIILTCFITLCLSNRVSWADPSAIVTFDETNLGGGIWQYDFTVQNTTPEPGYDLYAWYIDFMVQLETLDVLTSPENWDSISSLGDPPTFPFIAWQSLSPGAPPVGADIPPGDSLSGFSFKTNIDLSQIGANEPLLYSFYFTSPTPIPEPATILLIGSGLAGVGLLRRKKKNI